MTLNSPKIAIVIVTTNEKHYLKECIDSLNKQTYSKFDIFVIDNNSTDGTRDYLSKFFPKVSIVHNRTNEGFAKANNIGMKYVFNLGYDISILLNPDTKSDSRMIQNLINTYSSKMKLEKLGLIQPLLLLYDNPDLINSSGNPIHFLGYGYAGNYLKNSNIIKEDYQVLSATGGAALVTKNFFEAVGGFDETFFMYCEDQNMCWQGNLMGYKNYLSHKAIVYHKYHFNKNTRKMFYVERNRNMMLLENYSFRTLIILFPALLLNEILMIVYSIAKGWFLQKIESYFSLFIKLPVILEKRKLIQSRRVASDKILFRKMICKLDFEPMNSPSLQFINSIFCKYYKVVLNYI